LFFLIDATSNFLGAGVSGCAAAMQVTATTPAIAINRFRKLSGLLL
jgi:hypothetical protein